MKCELSSFGERLRAHRISAGLTQQEVAGRAGMSVRAVRYIEQGRVRRPRPESVRRLAAAVTGLEVAGGSPACVRPAGGEPGSTAGLVVAVLGPLTVHRDGEPVDVGPAKQRALLGLLALQPGRAVSHEEIISVLWGDDPPHSHRNLIHTYVARLRKALGTGAPVIVARHGGYLLAATEEHRLDLSRFEGLLIRAGAVRLGDPVTAMALYHDALGCWQGAVLADLTSRLHQHPAAVSAGRRRVTAALAYADLALDHGLHEKAAEQMWRLLEEEPLNEGLHARLMLALAGTGQQAAALHLFNELRVRLSEELGVEPGTEVKDAHLQVLSNRSSAAPGPRAGPAGTTVKPVPAQLPADVAVFTGRTTYLEQLNADLADAHEREPATAAISVIVGTAGVGKTTLAMHWAHRVRGGFPDGQLYVDLRGHDPGRPMHPIEALTLFLRALGVPAAHVPTEVDEAAGLYRSLLADRRVLIVLDNCNGVDQVRPLLPGAPGCAVLITSRDRLGGLVAKEGARRITLAPLSPDEALALLAAALGRERARTPAAAELVRLCAYLPLAIRISAANLDNDPNRGVAEYVAELREGNRLAALKVDSDRQNSVRAAFHLSYLSLPAQVRRLFRLLGLIPGPDFTADAAAALTASSMGRVQQRLTRLSAAHLIHQHSPGRYTLHDLLRLYAAERARTDETPEERRTASERLHGWYLGATDISTDLLNPGRRRFVQATAQSRINGPKPATPTEAVAWLEAERANLTAAVAMSARRGRHAETWRLAQLLPEFFFTRGHTHDWIETHDLALKAARKLGDHRAEAEILKNLGLAYWRSGRLPLAVDRHQRALTLDRAGLDVRGEAKTLNQLGFILDRTGQVVQALAHQQRSVTLYRQIDDRWGEGRALIGVGNAYRQLGRYTESLGHFQEALAVNREAGDRWGENMSLVGIGYAHVRLDLGTEAMAYLEQALTLTRDMGDQSGEGLALAGRAFAHLTAGRSAQAMDDFQHALVLTRGTGDRWTESLALAGTAFTHLLAGRSAQAMEDFQHLLALTRDIGDRWYEGLALTGLGHLHCHHGRHPQALTHYQRALTIARDVGNHGVQAEILSGLADVHRAMGDLGQAVIHHRHALAAALHVDDRAEIACARDGMDPYGVPLER